MTGSITKSVLTPALQTVLRGTERTLTLNAQGTGLNFAFSYFAAGFGAANGPFAAINKITFDKSLAVIDEINVYLSNSILVAPTVTAGSYIKPSNKYGDFTKNSMGSSQVSVLAGELTPAQVAASITGAGYLPYFSFQCDGLSRSMDFSAAPILLVPTATSTTTALSFLRPSNSGERLRVFIEYSLFDGPSTAGTFPAQ